MALSGIVFGWLVVELGTVWPAVVAHGAGNVAPVLGDEVPWLSLLALIATLSVAMVAGVLSLRRTHRLALARLAAWFRPGQMTVPAAS